MSNPCLRLHYFRSNLRITSTLIVSSLFLGLLSATAIALSTQAADTSSSPTPTVTPFPNSLGGGDTPVQQSKLSGQWQFQNKISGQGLIFIFTPDNKLFILPPSSAKTPVAQQLEYRIDPVPQPMHIDIIFPGTNESVKTIFEFTADDQLRLQVAGTNPGEPRPTDFSPNATLFQKISDATTLPAHAQVSDLQTEINRVKQAEAKQYIGSMNRAQQAYHLENNKFAPEINDLGIGIKPETKNYRYQIVPQGNSTQSVMMTAQAKSPELKSYTGAVFVVQENNEDLTIAAICETNEPSSTPPAMPAPPSNLKAGIQCPDNSHQLGR